MTDRKARTKRPIVIWTEVWDEFDTWYQAQRSKKHCKNCKQTTSREPDWEEQQAHIEFLVEKRLGK